MTSQISCIAHTKFTCEITRIENPNEQRLGRKPARLITSPGRRILLFLRELYSLFPKYSFRGPSYPPSAMKALCGNSGASRRAVPAWPPSRAAAPSSAHPACSQ
uniref:SFRICE_039794 n=1 Tax=Spodoptera frugiperda TaxID=7108 RepID=A0A2H1VQ78_SPOFR